MCNHSAARTIVLGNIYFFHYVSCVYVCISACMGACVCVAKAPICVIEEWKTHTSLQWFNMSFRPGFVWFDFLHDSSQLSIEAPYSVNFKMKVVLRKNTGLLHRTALEICQ